MSRLKQIEDLGRLGDYIIEWSEQLEELSSRACNDNAWFTPETVQQSLLAVAKKYLNRETLTHWLSNYPEPKSQPKEVGLILAGNIPLVGFHDILCVFLAGHNCIIKLSDKDKILIPHLLDKLFEINTAYTPRFTFAERLSQYDAIIATGSNTSASYFEKYFSNVPNIIRKNRNAVAVIFNDIKEDTLSHIGHDIFSYYGLGCRNVSKCYLEQGFDVGRIFRAVSGFTTVRMHNKYMNNYDYNNALYLLNSEEFLTNDFLILRENESITSRIACLHYEFFNDSHALSAHLAQHKDEIQCVVCDRAIEDIKTVPLGKAQSPALDDYADGIDTMRFLTGLK